MRSIHIQRPLQYRYAANLVQHIARQKGEKFAPFDGKLVIPRQLEIHLSNTWGKRCNAFCNHCQGRKLPTKTSKPQDDTLISLITNLKGQIPAIVFSGLYSEPTLNYRLIDIIEAIKKSGASFGLHTNGMLLKPLEESHSWSSQNIKFLTRLHSIGDEEDYISVSLDACSPQSFAITKGFNRSRSSAKSAELLFRGVLEGLDRLKQIKKSFPKETLKTRITYLLNEYNSSSERDFAIFMQIVKLLNVDSVRFSVPYAPFATSLADCNTFHDSQIEHYRRYLKMIWPYLSKNQADKPFIFIIPPEKQDVRDMNFNHCFSGYDAITLGADNYFYRCCSSAHPNFGHLRLGPLTDDVDKFYEMIQQNQQEDFNPTKPCFSKHIRCSRAALELNQVFENMYYAQE